MQITVVLLFVALIAAFYFKYKADKDKLDSILGKTREKDKLLESKQHKVERDIKELDKGILDLKKERKEERDKRESLTKRERADKWDN